jgi:amino acid adenylation domain-containing protein
VSDHVPPIDFAREEVEGSLPGRFERVAALVPGRPAIIGPDGELTYGALAAAATRLARAILDRRGPASEPVAVLVGHNPAGIVAILGALEAGKVYVTLDVAHPAARLRALVADAGARLVVSAGRHRELARAVAAEAGDVLDMDALDAAGDAGRPAPPLDGRSLAFLGYTSGSTGAPKGVLWDHRGILHRVMCHVQTLRIAPSDRLSLLHRLSVSASFRHMWGALLSGASVLLYEVLEEGVDALGRWLADARVTHCHLAASVFRQFAGALPPGENLPDLRLIWVANEPVWRSDADLHRSRFSTRCRLVNGYALTEAGTVATFTVDRDASLEGDLLPIGRPDPDKEVLLLDDARRPAPSGATGEIAVRSEFLALGYWGRPDLDREAFLPDPEGGRARIYLTGDLGRVDAEGRLVHLGRKDARPKLRGHFVDVLEVERRLVEHAGVAGAAVAVREDRPGDPRLVAYVVPADAAPTASELRAFIRERLPEHLVPSTWVTLEALPRSGTGKLDRASLPAPGRARPRLSIPFAPPRTPIESELSRIWADALGLDEVGIHDDFLELGGHSLLAAGLVARVREAFGVDLSAAVLLEAPRVDGMATVIAEHLLRTVASEARERLLAGLEGAGPGRAAAAQPAAAAEAPGATAQRSHSRAARATDSSTSSSSM